MEGESPTENSYAEPQADEVTKTDQDSGSETVETATISSEGTSASSLSSDSLEDIELDNRHDSNEKQLNEGQLGDDERNEGSSVDKAIPAVERIDLSELAPTDEEPPKSNDYDTGLVTASAERPDSTSRWTGSTNTELQDIMSLDAVLGTTLFPRRQCNNSLEESGLTLMNQRRFEEAALLLEAVYPMTFRQQLLLAECYLYAGKRSALKVCLEHAGRLMTSSLRLRIQDLSAAIKKALAKKSYVKALLLIHCSPRFAYLKLVPDEAIMFIERRVADYSHAVRAMVEVGGEMYDYAHWFVTNLMLDIILLFREISKAKFKKKIDCEARILTYFGLSYRAIEEHLKSLECFKQGLETLDLSFDVRVTYSKLYGTLLHNAGLASEATGDFAGAETLYVRAYEALENALDLGTQKEKEKTLKITEVNLKILREKMECLSATGDDFASDSTDELLKDFPLIDDDSPESSEVQSKPEIESPP